MESKDSLIGSNMQHLLALLLGVPYIQILLLVVLLSLARTHPHQILYALLVLRNRTLEVEQLV